MESISTFSSGMQSDLSKQSVSKNAYPQALNFRPNTTLGDSTGSLVNIKGNECKITYPVTQDVYKLQVYNNGGSGNNEVLTITVNGQTTSSIEITSATKGVDLYNLLIQLNNCYNNPAVGYAGSFAVAYKDDYIIIYQKPEYRDCGPAIPSVHPTTTVNTTIGNTSKYTLTWINTNNLPSSIYVAGQPPFILTNNNLTTIGSTFIDEDIYLLTSDDPVSIPSNDSFTTPGHIWKLSIDDITKQHTLKLLYTNKLDFTKYHPIAPSAITGRYESEEIKRIYWSDFYNKVRTINVEDPQLMALDVKLLSISPSTEFSVPTLNKILTGSLQVGCYQAAYRLTQTLGAISNYSELSELVYLIDKPLTDPFQNYQGGLPTVTSNKGIQFRIDNIDTAYDKIEVVLISRDAFNEIASVQALSPQPIPNTGTVFANFTGSETTTSVNIEDFLTISSTFTHAKTVETKDNRLFWGNVKNSVKSLDDYDSRAFRAKTSGADDIILTNSGITNTFQSTNPLGVDYVYNLNETEDTINTYYDSSGNPHTNACYYKPGTSKLGGKGLNISYEFGTISIPADNKGSIPTTDDWQINNTVPYRTVGVGNPNVDTFGNLSLNSTLYNYPQENSLGTTKYPYNAGILKGFQHEEIYRFGIQFFDLQGIPYFTKWIGDIKFPSYGDPNPNPDTAAQSFFTGAGLTPDFRLSYLVGSDNLFMQSLYIKFNVDVSSLEGRISGYQIVRVERGGSNKTIHGCGLLTPFIGYGNDTSSNDLYLPANFRSEKSQFSLNGSAPNIHNRYNPFPSQGYVETLNTNITSESNNNSIFKTFDCFDHHSGFGRPTFENGDKLLIRSRLISINYRSPASGYWQLFGNFANEHGTGNNYPQAGQPLYKSAYVPACGGIMTNDSPYDIGIVPYFLLKFKDDTVNYATASNNYSNHNYTLDGGVIAEANTSVTMSGTTLNNFGKDMYQSTGLCATSGQGNPCYGSKTTILKSTTNILLADTYGCTAPDEAYTGNIYKMLALYFKYNVNLYGGFTYSSRTLNTYIACSEYVPTIKNKLFINSNISLVTMGGDVFSSYYDHQKTVKTTSPPNYFYFIFNNAGVATTLGTDGAASFSTTLFFPCTNVGNAELRDGVHVNRNLTTFGYATEDQYIYYDYQSCENNVKKFFPKPLDFNLTDQWINRIYFSEIKINNETQDNWSVYKTNNFYDVEGNYGGINALVSLKNQIYYLQDRGIGMLLVNPVAMVDGGIGSNIKLGTGKTIEKHNYIAIDVGTKHQWSVYKSQNQICFLDVRNKRLYSFNGESLNPISDTKGQRNFIIKRLHDNILINDNPIINKGILTTYDYVNGEFLFTFNNENSNEELNSTDEFYTIAFSEIFDTFTSYYSFTPNIYINNHKYLLSTTIANKSSLYLHNYGQYGTFYGTKYPSKLKVLINDQPLSTKVLDNIAWHSESYNDNIEWSDDRNVYPGAITNPTYPDDIWYPNNTFTKARFYNNYQNTDWTTLTLSGANKNIRLVEQQFNLQIPRNKVNYDTTNNSTKSIFDPSILTKTSFGERLRDKWFICDLEYPNPDNLRFVIHNLKSILRISDR